MTRWLELHHVEQICYKVAVQSWDRVPDPIPPFSTRPKGKLESCLAVPRQTFDGVLLYPTLLDQAAILFYLLNKNHAFINGNKRIALTSLLVFLYLNNHWLEVDDLDELYRFSVKVAASLPQDRRSELHNIKHFIFVNSIDAAQLHERLFFKKK
jgi:death-on-curing protein